VADPVVVRGTGWVSSVDVGTPGVGSSDVLVPVRSVVAGSLLVGSVVVGRAGAVVVGVVAVVGAVVVVVGAMGCSTLLPPPAGVVGSTTSGRTFR
jgi:hypothetical protein